jgi:hypothetical protein
MQSQGSTAVWSHGDESAGTVYNQSMRLSTEPVQRDPDGSAMPADLDRTPAVLILVGSILTLLSTILPWGEKATFGFSLTTIQGENARIALAVLALASASIAVAVIFRRAYSAGVAILLVGLGVGQVGAGIWFGFTVMNEIRGAYAHLVLLNAIGTGVYMAGVGSVCALVGAVLARTRQRDLPDPQHPLRLPGLTTADADGDTEERLHYS